MQILLLIKISSCRLRNVLDVFTQAGSNTMEETLLYTVSSLDTLLKCSFCDFSQSSALKPPFGTPFAHFDQNRTIKVTPTTFYEISKISNICSIFVSVCIRVLHTYFETAQVLFALYFREKGVKTLKIYE